MSFPIRAIKVISVIVVGAGLVAAMLWLTFHRNTPAATPTGNQNQNIDIVRQQYADLYQAAWRQDEGQGNVLVTATLMTPTMIDLLGRDSGRSETENQLYRAVKGTAKNQVAVFLTLDSADGMQTDQAIHDSLTLTAEKADFTSVYWDPLIAPSRVTNSSVPIRSQVGVATFTATKPVDWSSLTSMVLVSRNIGDTPERKFMWTQPALWL